MDLLAVNCRAAVAGMRFNAAGAGRWDGKITQRYGNQLV